MRIFTANTNNFRNLVVGDLNFAPSSRIVQAICALDLLSSSISIGCFTGFPAGISLTTQFSCNSSGITILHTSFPNDFFGFRKDLAVLLLPDFFSGGILLKIARNNAGNGSCESFLVSA